MNSKLQKPVLFQKQKILLQTLNELLLLAALAKKIQLRWFVLDRKMKSLGERDLIVFYGLNEEKMVPMEMEWNIYI